MIPAAAGDNIVQDSNYYDDPSESIMTECFFISVGYIFF